MKKLDRLFQELSKDKRCFFCRKPANASHHIIYKSQSAFLRWDKMNCLPVCIECHKYAHDIGVDAVLELLPEKQKVYLVAHKNVILKDYLLKKGITENEFMKLCEKRL